MSGKRELIVPKDRNAFIETYLDHYRRMANTDFAVLVKGPWGCGKTYFIKRYCEKLNGLQKDAAWYVSLNGVTTVQEVDERLFQVAHPIIGSKGARMALHLLKGAVGAGLTITTGVKVNGDKSLGASLKLGEIVKSFDLTSKTGIGSRLLVFDDLERTSISREALLGYISGFVEDGAKVVVVAAENLEIQGEEKKPPKGKFKDQDGYSEKVIGKTFEIQNNLEALYGVLCSREEHPQAYDCILQVRKDVVRRIGKAAGDGCNYRALRHAFRDLNYALGLINPSIRKHSGFTDFANCFAAWYLPLSYATHLGWWSEKDFKQMDCISVSKDGTMKQMLVRFDFDPYGFCLSGRMGLSCGLMKKLLWNHAVTSEEITEDVLKTPNFIEKAKMPEWCQYWNWFLMEDDEAAKIQQTIERGIAERRYRHPGEIVHIFAIYMDHVANGVVKMSKRRAISLYKQYVKDLIESRTLILEEANNEGMYGYGGYAWWKFDFKDKSGWKLETLYQYLKKKMDRLLQQKKDRERQELICSFASHYDQFVAELRDSTLARDILSYADPGGFFSEFMKLSNRDKVNLTHTLVRRWDQCIDLERYAKEMPFIDGVIACASKRLKRVPKPGTPTHAAVVRFLDDLVSARRKIVTLLKKNGCWHNDNGL